MATSYVPPVAVPASAYSKLPPRIRIEAAIETLIEILDAADPDTDFEEIGAEDSFQTHDDDGVGCPIGDPDKSVDDGDERDLADEGEQKTWSHAADHPAELFIGGKQ
jgi:hypothetical protein